MGDLTVAKRINEIKFDLVWGELESKKKFPETITHKIFETNSCVYEK